MEPLACFFVCLLGQSPTDPFGAAASSADPAPAQYQASDAALPGAFPAYDAPRPLTVPPASSVPAPTVARESTTTPAPAAVPVEPFVAEGPADETPAQRQARQRSEQLLGEWFGPADDALVQGRAVSLTDVVSPTQSVERQTTAAQAYWQLAWSMAECRLADDLRRKLEQVATLPGVAEGGQLPWSVVAAQRTAEARLLDARLQVVAAQHRLMELTAGDLRQPPLAVDLPHAGPYWTWFEQIYANRPTPLEAQRLHHSLPLRHQAIDLAAEAVEAGYQQLDAVGEAYVRRQASLDALLAAIDATDRQQRAFAAAVRDYNHDIARYALAVPHSITSPQRLAAMLIRPRGAVPGVLTGSGSPLAVEGVQPATLLDTDAQRSAAGDAPALVARRDEGPLSSPAGNPLRGSGEVPMLPGNDYGAPGLLPPAPEAARPLPPPHPFPQR